MAKAKRIRGINCNSAASIGVRLVLVTRFEEFYGLHKAALDYRDPEGVHSMRVASRRLRSVLRDFIPYLRKRGLTSVQKQMKRIADALGDVRDQDVAIFALEKIETHGPAVLSPALKTFIAAKKEIRDQSRQELQAIFEKGDLKQLAEDFVRYVEAVAATRQRSQSKAQITFAKMSGAIILDRLKELEDLSNGLFSPLESEGLHDLRIAAKRLRYALELFQQCWGRSLISHAKRAARIQSALGEVHDCDVWIEALGKQIGIARKHKENEQVAAFVWLLSHFMKQRTKYLRQAFVCWREWEAHDVGGKLRAALND